MSRAFRATPAKSAFGTLNQVVYQGDYISNKKAKLTYCANRNYTNCNKVSYASSYDQYNLFKNGRYLNAKKNGCILPFDKQNLIAGLYTKLNLTDVCTVIDGSPCSKIYSCDGCLTGAKIDKDATEPFYQMHTIDPVGLLFGKSECGVNNYAKYMIYSPATK